MKSQLPEIMAPVSSRAMLEAAIHNGADSVYFGMPHYNARGRSDHLSFQEIQGFIELAHLYGVKAYIAFNVLIFDRELKDALKGFLDICRFAPDAWIIQDVGFAVLLKEIFPEVRLHASTQMTITNPLDISFYGETFFRYTLSRELSISEIKLIREQVSTELEVFIHGSLCIAYSGQCFTSSGFGGRSANRGECAQSCRHEYSLFIDGKEKQTSGSFLVSPADLTGSRFIKPLADMEINALKIEGRLKTPEYVAAAIQSTRDVASNPFFIPARLTYSRNGGSGWLDGIDHANLVNDKINSHTGILSGTVQQVHGYRITVQLLKDFHIHKGDGIFFSGGNQALGGFIYNVSLTKKDKKYFAELLLSREFPHFKIKTGMEMYLASSPLVNQELKKSYADKQKWKRLPVTAYLRGKINEKLSLTFTDRDGNQAVAHNDTLLERAEKNPISIEFTRKEIAALSGTPFVLDEFRDLRVEVDMDAFIPHKTLKELRQKVSETLINMRIMKNAPAFGEKQPENIDSILKNRYKISNQKQSVENPRLHILVRNLLQLDQVLNFKNKKPDTIYLDLTYGYEYRDAVIKIKNHGMKAGLTTARVYKPGEETQLKKIMESNPDTILVRNAASLHYLKNKFLNLVGDFSLNITNQKSAEFFCSKGLGRITPSHDLISDSGKTQDPAILFEFLNSFPSDMVEINILYYLSSFYMEYCLFSKYLSNGKSSAQCGYPCTKHNLALKDRKGEIHPVIADRNCRNEMFNGRPKNLANYIPQFLDKGVKNFRIEMSPDVKNMDYDLKKIEAIYNYF